MTFANLPHTKTEPLQLTRMGIYSIRPIEILQHRLKIKMITF